jgi:hypothetical protein
MTFRFTLDLGGGVLRKKFELWSAIGSAFDASSEASGAFLAEELVRSLGHGEETHDALVDFNDPIFPSIEVNTEWLGEAADNVVDERNPLRLFFRRSHHRHLQYRRPRPSRCPLHFH